MVLQSPGVVAEEVGAGGAEQAVSKEEDEQPGRGDVVRALRRWSVGSECPSQSVFQSQ